jgi:tetratricopeptide (TPR) repeat protein
MPGSDIRARLQEAVSLHRNGRLDDAERSYRALLQQDPDLFDAHHLLGVLYLQQRDYAQALAAFDRALAIDPHSGHAHHNRGRTLEALHRLDEALASHETALGIEPANVAMLNDRGLVAMALNRVPVALADFDRALALRPDFIPALGNRGLALTRLGLNSAALDSVERILAIDPDHVEALVNRGRLLQFFGDGEAAIASFRRVLELKPGLTAAKGALAETCAGLGRFDEAARLCREIVTAMPAADARDRLLALRTLAHLPRAVVDIDVTAQLEAAQRPADMSPVEFETIRRFGAAAILHERGAYEAAWRSLALANEPMRPTAALDRDARRRRYAASLARVDEAAADLDAAVAFAAGMPILLFILGASRSGKTTLERLLASVAGVRAGYENSIVGIARERVLAASGEPPDTALSELGSRARTQFECELTALVSASAADAAVVTCTAPGSIDDIVDLVGLVPNLRVVFVKRDRADTMLRIYMKQYTGNSYACDLGDVAAYLDFHDSMIERLARRLPRHSRVVSYEAMIENPAAIRAEIARLCGLPAPQEPLPEIGDDRGCAAPYAAHLAMRGPD